MRVLQVLRPSAGGMLRSVEMLTERLRENGDEVEIVGQDFIPSRANFNKDRAAAVKLRSLAKEYDLIHAHGYRGAWIAGWALGKTKPWLWTAHNLPNFPKHPVKRALYKTLFRRRVSSACATIAVSTAVAIEIKTLEIAAPFTAAIYGGIDLSDFEAIPDKASARHEWNVAPDAPVIAAVGRLSKEKGFDLLLEAMETLWQTHPKAVLLLAGDGPLKEEIQKQAQSLRRSAQVHLLGFYGELANLYAAADVVCVPSRSEGLGLVAIEAMACSRPVVAFKVGGLPEVVYDQHSGILVEPNNPKALAAALSLCFTDPSRARFWGEIGRKNAFEQFDIAKTVERTIGVYRQVLGKRQ